MTDQRNDPRFGPLILRAHIVVADKTHEGYLTNVSAGGAFLAIDDPPEIGSDVSIRAILPWSLGEIRASARVVWRNGAESTGASAGPSHPANSIKGVGVSFTTLAEGSDEALRKYLERFAELASRLDESASTHEGH